MIIPKLLVYITLICLVGFPYLSQQAIAHYTLPDHSKAVQYIYNLIGYYNGLVRFYGANRPDFDSIKGNFSLYHDAGHSFLAVVLQSVPDNADYVALMFFPIRAGQPNVTMDYNDTFSELFPHTIAMKVEYGLLQNNLLEYGNITIRLPLVFVVLSTDILGDYIKNSADAAQYIYQQDTKQISVHHTYSISLSETIGISEALTLADPNFITKYLTLTVTTTQISTSRTTVVSTNNQTVIVQPATTYVESSVQSNYNPVQYIQSNPRMAGIVSILALVCAALALLFGSLKDAAKDLIGLLRHLFGKQNKVKE